MTVKPAALPPADVVRLPTRPVVAATYNIHSCRGRDRARDPDRILAVLREIDADIVGMQEVCGAGSGPGGEQFAYFAEKAGMHAAAARNLRFRRDPFGNLLLTRWPILRARVIDLSVGNREPRSAIDAVIARGDQEIRVIVTHLGLRFGEQSRQVDRLAGAVAEDTETPLLMMGDFNLWGPARRLLRRIGADRGAMPASFPARRPLMALDRIWSLPAGLVLEHRTHRSALAVAASDHLPVVAHVRFAEPGGALAKRAAHGGGLAAAS